MGIFGTILDVATGIIPGTLDDKLVSAGRAAFGGSTSSTAPIRSSSDELALTIGQQLANFAVRNTPTTQQARTMTRGARKTRATRNQRRGFTAGAGPCDGGVMIRGRCVTPDLPLIDIDRPASGGGGGGGRRSRAARDFDAVTGSFGMPAIVPVIESRKHAVCPSGFVLGEDELCYPKAVLGSRNRFRKWKGARRSPISAHDLSVARKADSVANKVKDLSKALGMKTPTKKRR